MSSTLAIDGGVPLRTTPMPGWPAPGDGEVAAVERVLRSGRISYWTGEEGRLLEREYAASLGVKHAVALANGTLALEAALRGFGIGAGDEVVVPARTFIATASSVVAVGAVPVVADVDPTTGCITAQTAREALTERSRAIIPVHVGGWPVEMDEIMALAEQHDCKVIEDCAQAHGGSYRGRPLGSIGHAGTFSFCQDKIIPAGEGGLFVTDDAEAYRRVWEYKDHGKSLAKLEDPGFSAGTASFRWIHDSFGSNWRLPEMEAAIARVGLSRLAAWHAKRTDNALLLARSLAETPGIDVALPAPHLEHAFYRLYARVLPEYLAAGWDRDRILRAVAAEGVPVQYGTCAEIYREAAFAEAGVGPENRLPGAAAIHDTWLAFFVHPVLSERDMLDTASAVSKVMAVATR